MEAQTHTNLRRPSTELPVLIDQLQRELEILERDGERAPETHLYRAYLHYAYTLAWEGVSRGDLEAPRRVLDGFLETQPFADRRRPEDLGPVEEAALELDFTIQSLYRACDAVEERRVEVHLEKRLSESDRQVLRVLAGTRDRYLRRVDVYDRLDPATRPTPVRVGQILAELYEDGLLDRVFQRAQGSAQASFYALDPRGIDFCKQHELWPEGLEEVEDEEPAEEMTKASDSPFPDWTLEVAHASLDPRQPRRSLAIGTLANSHLPEETILEALKTAASSTGRGMEVMGFLMEAACQVVRTKQVSSQLALA